MPPARHHGGMYTITPEIRAVQARVVRTLERATEDLDAAEARLLTVAAQVAGSSRGLRALQETVERHRRALAGLRDRLAETRGSAHVG